MEARRHDWTLYVRPKMNAMLKDAFHYEVWEVIASEHNGYITRRLLECTFTGVAGNKKQRVPHAGIVRSSIQLCLHHKSRSSGCFKSSKPTSQRSTLYVS